MVVQYFEEFQLIMICYGVSGVEKIQESISSFFFFLLLLSQKRAGNLDFCLPV